MRAHARISTAFRLDALLFGRPTLPSRTSQMPLALCLSGSFVPEYPLPFAFARPTRAWQETIIKAPTSLLHPPAVP